MPKTVSPRVSLTGVPDSVPRLVWENIEPGDTIEPLLVKRQFGFVGCIQLSGTWGGASVALEQSNDALTWFQALDPLGNMIDASSNAMFEFSLAAAYLKPKITGGVGTDVDVIIVLRG
jgi:hypothetical protein